MPYSEAYTPGAVVYLNETYWQVVAVVWSDRHFVLHLLPLWGAVPQTAPTIHRLREEGRDGPRLIRRGYRPGDLIARLSPRDEYSAKFTTVRKFREFGKEYTWVDDSGMFVPIRGTILVPPEGGYAAPETSPGVESQIRYCSGERALREEYAEAAPERTLRPGAVYDLPENGLCRVVMAAPDSDGDVTFHKITGGAQVYRARRLLPRTPVGYGIMLGDVVWCHEGHRSDTQVVIGVVVELKDLSCTVVAREGVRSFHVTDVFPIPQSGTRVRIAPGTAAWTPEAAGWAPEATVISVVRDGTVTLDMGGPTFTASLKDLYVPILPAATAPAPSPAAERSYPALAAAPPAPDHSPLPVTVPEEPMSNTPPTIKSDAAAAALSSMFKAASALGNEAGFRLTVRQGSRQLRRGAAALLAPRLVSGSVKGRARARQADALRETLTANLDTATGDAIFKALLGGLLAVAEDRLTTPAARERVGAVKRELLVQATEGLGQLADPLFDALADTLFGGVVAGAGGVLGRLEALALAEASPTAALPAPEALEKAPPQAVPAAVPVD